MRRKTIFSILAVFLLLLSVLPMVSACDGLKKEQTVKYKDFGAKGDGKTDDFAAICAAHQYANENGLAVEADDGAIYYIGGKTGDSAHKKSCVIKTNTYWKDARFIIDDVGIAETSIAGNRLFVVQSDVEPQKVDVPDGYSLAVGAKKVGIKFDEPKLLHIVNNKHKDFVRHGPDQNNGADRQEVVLVNKNGRIDPSTPLTWDYDQVTSITAYSTTDKPVTISGGRFTTIANDGKDYIHKDYTYYFSRNLMVCRSNTTVKNVIHNIVYGTGTETNGSPYAGFFGIEKTTNVRLENCIAQGNRTNSSYEFHNSLANKITYKNVKQQNAFDGNGIHGSNYCRNFTLDGCSLNRFDAHKGVYNATLKNSTFKYICVTGFGKLLLENVTIQRISDAYVGEGDFIGLRSDYGAFWRGDIVIKNCTWNTSAAVNYIITESWWHDWDFGYDCYMPNVTIDGLTITYYGTKLGSYPYFYVFSNVNYLTTQKLAESPRPLHLVQKVSVKNCNQKVTLTHNQTGVLDGATFVIDGVKQDLPGANK